MGLETRALVCLLAGLLSVLVGEGAESDSGLAFPPGHGHSLPLTGWWHGSCTGWRWPCHSQCTMGRLGSRWVLGWESWALGGSGRGLGSSGKGGGLTCAPGWGGGSNRTEGSREPVARPQPTQPACPHGSHSCCTYSPRHCGRRAETCWPSPVCQEVPICGGGTSMVGNRENGGCRGRASREHQGRLPSGGGLQAGTGRSRKWVGESGFGISPSGRGSACTKAQRNERTGMFWEEVGL